MTRWLQAARLGQWHTDKLTELTEPNHNPHRGTVLHAEHGFRQYSQSVSTASNPRRASAPSEVLSVLSVRQYGPSRNRGISEAVGAAVILAFEDYAAMNDPLDPRAWT
jgi:hypothetical protein